MYCITFIRYDKSLLHVGKSAIRIVYYEITKADAVRSLGLYMNASKAVNYFTLFNLVIISVVIAYVFN